MGKQLRFLVDDTLRGLAKKLRMIGYDTLERGGESWWAVMAKAKQDHRVVVTLQQDLRTPPDVEMWVVETEQTNQQVQEVLDRISSDVDPPEPLSRCLVCNEVVEELAAETARPRVPPMVAQAHSVFCHCPKCGRIYWAGSHFHKIRAWMERWGIDHKLGVSLPNPPDTKE
jgi:uncharacterized protein with PIN domain